MAEPDHFQRAVAARDRARDFAGEPAKDLAVSQAEISFAIVCELARLSNLLERQAQARSKPRRFSLHRKDS